MCRFTLQPGGQGGWGFSKQERAAVPYRRAEAVPAEPTTIIHQAVAFLHMFLKVGKKICPLKEKVIQTFAELTNEMKLKRNEKLPSASSGQHGRVNCSGLCRHAFESSVDNSTALLRRDVITSRARRQGWDKEGRARGSSAPAAATVSFQSPVVHPPRPAPPALHCSSVGKCESYSTDWQGHSKKSTNPTSRQRTGVIKEQLTRGTSVAH